MVKRKFIYGGAVVAGIFGVTPATHACTLSITNGGAMTLSPSATILGSEESGGVAAALLIASTGAATVQVSAPTLIENPSVYNDTSDVVETRYTGAGALNGVVQNYTDTTTSFSFGIIPLSALSMNARITNLNAFAEGTYRVRTVVTCF